MDSQEPTNTPENQKSTQVEHTLISEHRRYENPNEYIVGWRLHTISAALLLALFTSQMESSVTSTAVLVITNDLGGFSTSSWLFTAYLLTYSGLPIIWAKISDILGRKLCLIVSLLLFIVFSAACGAAQSMKQLIMFRWAQGIGGSGIYSLGTLVFWELLPPEKWALNSSIVTGVFALSLIAGPLLGGAITQHGNWRWIFLINIPIVAVACALLIWAFPSALSNEPAAVFSSETVSSRFSRHHLRRIDIVGGCLLLGCCLLSTTAIQQTAVGFSWLSSSVLPLLVLASVGLPLFLSWQWYVTTYRTYPEPVFPWRFCQSWICIGMILNAFLAGMILTTCIVQLPQRFMTVNGLSPLAAALRLLPFGVLVPIGASLAAVLMGKWKVPPVIICVAGAIFQILGLSFLSRTSSARHISPSQYGLQIITAIGNGFVNTAVVLLIPYAMQNRDLGVGNATLAQFRILGGTFGIAITTCVATPFVHAGLTRILPTDVVTALLDRTGAIYKLPSATQDSVRLVFADGYNLQMKILIGVAAVHIPAILMMWSKKTVVVG